MHVAYMPTICVEIHLLPGKVTQSVLFQEETENFMGNYYCRASYVFLTSIWNPVLSVLNFVVMFLLRLLLFYITMQELEGPCLRP